MCKYSSGHGKATSKVSLDFRSIAKLPRLTEFTENCDNFFHKLFKSFYLSKKIFFRNSSDQGKVGLDGRLRTCRNQVTFQKNQIENDVNYL